MFDSFVFFLCRCDIARMQNDRVDAAVYTQTTLAQNRECQTRSCDTKQGKVRICRIMHAEQNGRIFIQQQRFIAGDCKGCITLQLDVRNPGQGTGGKG